MNRLFLLLFLALISPQSVKADFGDADFPVDMFKYGPKSYHDVWCKKIRNRCRVRFQGSAMWVEGQGGIQASQYLLYRYENEKNEHYNYVLYESRKGVKKQALFLIAKNKAQREFMKAMYRWKEQKSFPIPNYRLPASQGSQDTQGRDKGLNPYGNPPIKDWSEKTTKESPAGINCDLSVWRNKPQCIDY